MIVLDANVAVKGYLEEPGSPAALQLLSGTERLLAPELIRLEVAGVFCRRARQGVITAAEAEARFQDWQGELAGGLFTLAPDRDLAQEAFALSVKIKHNLDDCLYLAVAIRADAPLITADRPFCERARKVYKHISILAGCEAN
jgi:predicted nucleic acid-binding protein